MTSSKTNCLIIVKPTRYSIDRRNWGAKGAEALPLAL